MVTETQFFNLANGVLQETGRGSIPADSHEEKIIRVLANDRVLQILAGPGSGKTEMLVWRVLYELFVLETPSERLIVTTFTRRAAAELSLRLAERCDALIRHATEQSIEIDDPHVHDVQVGTIHSLCDALLSEWDADYLDQGIELIDEVEAKIRLAKHRMRLRHVPGRLAAIDELVCLFRPPWDPGWPRRSTEHVDLLRALLEQQVETWLPRGKATGMTNGLDALHPGLNVTGDLQLLAERWEEYLSETRVLDFTTIQKRFLESQASITPHVSHVFVDEFQDTNPIQLAIHLGWLNNPECRLTVVGDDDQSIYRFRGSDLACFTGLETDCAARGLPFRREVLEENRRSTRTIVQFAERFRTQSTLSNVSMPKRISPPPKASLGDPVRLLTGPWSSVARFVALEVQELGDARDAAVLGFSTSERGGATYTSVLRREMEERGLRVYNPHSKTASDDGSPVFELLGLLAYFFDPVELKNVPGHRGPVLVWATADEDRRPYAKTADPGMRMTTDYASIQRKVRGGRSLREPEPIRPLLRYLDELRDRIVAATQTGSPTVRLTLSGLVARLLSMDYFRLSGFNLSLFRQALFTQLIESNVAATRQSTDSLDVPLSCSLNAENQYVWPRRFWSLLNVFGPIVSDRLDDPEVDAFADRAVLLLTFHQAKGLEFEHVYVTGTGRDAYPHNVLVTQLFSGTPTSFTVVDGQPIAHDRSTLLLAQADRDREIYVALTRAKGRLTILADPQDSNLHRLNESLAAVFSSSDPEPVPGHRDLFMRSFTYE